MASARRFDAAVLNVTLIEYVPPACATRALVTSVSVPTGPGRSRPLCAYPQHAHYKGTGDPQDTRNFECRQ